MIRLYSVTFSDGAADMADSLSPCPMAELGELDTADASAIMALAPGESLRLGGGAAPLATITRI